LWFDAWLGDVPEKYRKEMVAYYYNQSVKWSKQVMIAYKQKDLPEGVAILDIERGRMKELSPVPWQTDDSVAKNSWGYVANLQLRQAKDLIDELIDIVSKNGVLLLNVAPKADGTIPEDQRQILLEMGRWLAVNGEAIRRQADRGRYSRKVVSDLRVRLTPSMQSASNCLPRS
jgi:alpha-L-fucosidase